MSAHHPTNSWAVDLYAVTSATAALGEGSWLITHLLLAAAVRGLFAVHFTASEGSLGEASSIFVHNVRIMLAVAGLAYCASRLRSDHSQAAYPAARHGARLIDFVLAMAAGLQVALAGVLLGAYGTRQLEALMPFAPVEIAAWIILMALYLRARRQQLAWREATIALACALVLLALAASLEAFAGSS